MKTLSLLLLFFLFVNIVCQNMVGTNCTGSFECGGLVCKPNFQCGFCSSNIECQNLFFLYECKNLSSTGPICLRKNVFPNVSLIDGIIIVVSWLVGTLAAVSGIGGSALFVPILQVIGQFPLSVSIPISKATVFGLSISTIFILVRRRHPNTNTPLINYSISLVFVPSVLLGTLIGVLLILILPEIILLVFLMLILPTTGIRTLTRACQLWRKESLSDIPPIDLTGPPQEIPMQDPQKYDQLVTIEEPNYHVNTEDMTSPREKYFQVGLIFLSWIFLLIMTLFKGGFGTSSIVGIAPCSAWYWVLYALCFPFVGAIIVLSGIFLYFKDKRLLSQGYTRKFYDFKWSLRNTILLPVLSMTSGVLSTALGAAMLRNNVLTEMGVDVEIAAATCSFINLWDSSLSTFLFIIHGSLPFDYGLVFFATGLFAGFVGQYIFGYIIEKLGRKSLISFILGILIIISSITMFSIGIYRFIDNSRHGRPFVFKSPCNARN